MLESHINDLKKDLLSVCKKIANSNMVVGTWGNVSIKVNDDTYIITPSGKSYERLDIDDLVVVDKLGNKISGKFEPSSELLLHLIIYKKHSCAKAVLHTHSIYATAYAAMRKSIPPIVEDCVQIIGGEVPIAEYALPGSQELADNAIRALGNKKATLLANHGVVAWGENLESALIVASVVEKTAQIAAICATNGGAVILPTEDIKLMHDFYQEHYLKRQLDEEGIEL